MSASPIDLVLPLYDAVERGEGESQFDRLAPDLKWDMRDLALPDMARVYYGHEGLREFWAAWLSSWYAIEFTQLTPERFGEDAIVEVHQRNTGRASGVPVDFHYFQAWVVRDGRVTACHAAQTKAGALRALGHAA